MATGIILSNPERHETFHLFIYGSYERIAQAIKHDLDTELGFTFSVGLAPNKVLAKIGSKWQKPSGLTAIPGRKIHLFLEKLPVAKVWGIDPRPRRCWPSIAFTRHWSMPNNQRPGCGAL